MKQKSTLWIVFMMVAIIVVVLFAACKDTMTENEFMNLKENTISFDTEARKNGDVSNEICKLLKQKFIEAIEEENGLIIEDAVLNSAPAGSGHYMAITVLTDKKEVICYEVAGRGITATSKDVDNLIWLVNGLYAGDEELLEKVENLEFKLEDNFLKVK